MSGPYRITQKLFDPPTGDQQGYSYPYSEEFAKRMETEDRARMRWLNEMTGCRCADCKKRIAEKNAQRGTCNKCNRKRLRKG
jgi:hypothetical protein